MRIKLFFHEVEGITEIKKITAVNSTQLHIKRVLEDETTEVRDFNFANLRTGQTWTGGRGDGIYTVEKLSDDSLFVKIMSYGTAEDIDVTETTYPFYPYLADGETETTETATATHADVPAARTQTQRRQDTKDALQATLSEYTFNFARQAPLLVTDTISGDRRTNTYHQFAVWIGYLQDCIDTLGGNDQILTQTEIETEFTTLDEWLGADNTNAVLTFAFYQQVGNFTTRRNGQILKYPIWNSQGTQIEPSDDAIVDYFNNGGTTAMNRHRDTMYQKALKLAVRL